MDKVIVTGGAGFIGSHLCEALVKHFDVHVIDDLSTGRRDHVPSNATFHRASILDYDEVRSVVDGAQTIFHLAAAVSVQESLENPWRTTKVNVDGTVNILQAAREASVNRVVISSTCAVYGDQGDSSIQSPENRPNPQSVYAASKLSCEHYAQAYAAICGVHFTSLRYFNVYGPRQDPRSSYAAAIPKFVSQALAGEPLEIFGDGLQSRDFVHVDDIVNANLLAARAPHAHGGPYNIGTGQAISILSLAESILRETGGDSRIVHRPARAGEVRHSRADISAAMVGLNYAPRITIDSGLKATVAWYRRTQDA